MKNILLTGGTGYIGSHTAVELLEKGYSVVAYDNLCNSSKDVVDAVNKITGKKLEFIKGDILDFDALDKAFSKHKFDAVIHFAGLKAVGESVEKPLEYYENNVGGTIQLLKVMKKHNVSKIVFSSSATVYGSPKSLPIFEDFELGTTNPYGETKLMIEHILQDYAGADKNFTAVILRYFNPIGAHSSGLIGEDPNGIPNNLAPYIAQVIEGKREHLNVFGNDYPTIDGTGVRDYIHVVDLALGHVAAIENVTTPSSHIYNLGTGNGTSVFQLVGAFEKACGKKVPYKVASRRQGDIAACYANADKAKIELNWQATRSVDEMCGSIINFIDAKKN